MSRISIYPPYVELLPGKKQTFTAASVPPPALWTGVTDSGDIKTDFSLEVDGAGSQTSGAGGHWLFSGLGIVEFTIDDQCKPTGSGFLKITGFINDINGFQYYFEIKVNPGNTEIRNEAASIIYSDGYAAVSGDVYRLELAAGFRFYRNGALIFSRVNLGTTVVYPMTYLAAILETTTSAPTRIPPPRLIGDWQISPFTVWTAPSHGAISPTSGPTGSVEYSGGTIPGTYTLTTQLEAAADANNVQKATATIYIPPLKIVGPTSVTMQPGAKMRPKTNYDAEVGLISWSVVAGTGSFSQGEFTAGTSPGVTIIRATCSVNGLSADIKVRVPVVISNATGYTAAKASEQIDFDINTLLMPIFHAVGPLAEGTGDVLPKLPAGFDKDDALFLLVETANEAVSTPGGWFAVTNSPQGTGTGGGTTSTRITLFWRRAEGNEVPPTITDPGDHAAAQIVAVRGCINTGNAWDVTAGDTGASSTSVSIPGATTMVVNCLVMLIVANATDTATPQTSGYTNSDLANLTERTDVNSTQGNGGGFALATGEKAAIGAYGATAATLANASVQGRMSIALKPNTITWSASAGSINSSSGLWTAPSQAGQTVRITATVGGTAYTIDIPVLEVFPFSDFSLPVSWDRNLNALVETSEDRSSRMTREKAPPHDSYPVKLTSRTLSECNTVDAFFDAQGLGKPFILEDKVRNIRKVGWFDSPIRHEARDECDIDLSFQFLEARL